MSPAMPFDEATSRRVEATYGTADVAGQRRAVLAALSLKAGEDVLDIGSGPGFLACEMSAEVGPGGSVTGVNPTRPCSPSPGRGHARLARPRRGSGPVRRPHCPAPRARSMPSPPPRSMSTWRTCLPRWPRRGGCCARGAGSRPRHRLGLGRLAVRRRRPDAPGAPRLGGAPGRSSSAGAAGRAPREHRLLGNPPGGRPAAQRRLRPGHLQRRPHRVHHRFRVPAQRDHSREITAWASDLTGLGPAYFFSLNRYLFLGVRKLVRGAALA